MAFDGFLKIDGGPKGESTDKSHAGEIQLSGFSHTVSNPSTIGSGTGGSGGGKVTIGTFNITKQTDASSALLYQACAAGDHWATATVTLRKAGKNALEFLIYTFTELYCDSMTIQANTTGASDTPVEQVAFSFASIHEKYVPQNTDGTGGSPMEGGWNVTTNEPQ